MEPQHSSVVVRPDEKVKGMGVNLEDNDYSSGEMHLLQDMLPPQYSNKKPYFLFQNTTHSTTALKAIQNWGLLKHTDV